jgi:CSLREA domain-containing protein
VTRKDLTARFLAGALAAIILAPLPLPAATLTVNSTADAVAAGDGNCTLREAVTNVNAIGDTSGGDCTPGAGSLGGDTIVLAPAATYNLTLGELTVSRVVTVTGNGAIINAGGTSRIFRVTGVGNFESLTLNGVTLTGGSGVGAQAPGCLTQSGTGPCGGAVSVEPGASLAINGSTLTANTALVGGAVWIETGFLNNGSATIFNTTISNNIAALGGGIGTSVVSPVTIVNSSLSGNVASSNGTLGGGAIFAVDTVLQIGNTTLSGNSANGGGGGLCSVGMTITTTSVLLDAVTITNNTADADNNGNGDGGGILQSIAGSTMNATAGTTVLMGCVVAGNVDRGGQNPDIAEVGQTSPPAFNVNLPCQQAGICSNGYNVIGNVGTTNFGTNTVGDLYGDPNASTQKFLGSTESATPVNPLLAPLVGTPAHHPLLPGSPAIDRFLRADCVFSPTTSVNPLTQAFAPITTDGRGVARPFDGDANTVADCDSGAYEYQGIADSCGNGTLDLGEQCDDGNVAAGDCCSATCTFEAAGSPCTEDGLVCTAGTCDTGGTCVQVSTDALCDDGDPCTVDTCTAGVCATTLPGLGGLTCALNRIPAVQCGGAPLPNSLGRKITRKVAQAKNAVVKAFQVGDAGKKARAEKLRARANKQLQGILRLTTMAAKRKGAKGITAACKQSVDALVQSRQQVVAGFAF